VGVFRACPILGYLKLRTRKLRISNLASTFIASIRTKAREKFYRKGSMGVSRLCPFFGYPNYLRNGKSYELQILNAHL